VPRLNIAGALRIVPWSLTQFLNARHERIVAGDRILLHGREQILRGHRPPGAFEQQA
jgi:hypothetical protein